MTRCLVFDASTAAAVRDGGNHAELHADATPASTISEAVQEERTVVIVVPAGPDRATVARITPPQRTRS